MKLLDLKETDYLGDGVYIGVDHFGTIWIVTNNGLETTNSICLEGTVILGLLEYLKKKGLS